jgi:hypothetical protein
MQPWMAERAVGPFTEDEMNRWLFSAVILLAGAAPAFAQAPGVTSLFPAGGQVGTVVEAAVTGSNLADVQALLVSGRGVQIERLPGGSATACPVKLTIAPNAEAGTREIRLVTRNGVSNGAQLWVGRYPAAREKEPNDRMAEAQALPSFPVTVDGQVDKAADVDRYPFQVAAGETWVFSINAAQHRSDLDPYLTLFDSRGRSIAFAMETFGKDPRLVHTFAAAGKYTVEVRDSLFRGGAGYTYRLSLGKLPVVTRWSPLGGRRGQTVQVALAGINLGATKELQVALPGEAGRSSFRVTPDTAQGPANPIDLLIEDQPEVEEHEPNNEVKAAVRTPALPLRASGRIDAKGDRDLFAFTATEKQALSVDLQARRIGSRLDSVIRVLDATGKELASNDDAVGRDSRLTFTAPAAGEYFAEVRSLSGKGGDDYFYLLRIGAPPTPDFALSVTPDNPTAPAGGAVVLTVTADRRGYAGDIQLRAENLPAGITVSAGTLRSGQNSAILTLTAAAGTPLAYTPVRIVGTAGIGGQGVARVAVGQERFQPPLATPAQAQNRETELLVAATGPEPPYLLTAMPAVSEIRAGEKLELTVKCSRKAPYKEAVVVTVVGLPPNVTASALTINGDKTEGKLTLSSTGKAPVGPAMIAIQGTAKTVLVATPAIPLTLLPAK